MNKMHKWNIYNNEIEIFYKQNKEPVNQTCPNSMKRNTNLRYKIVQI